MASRVDEVVRAFSAGRATQRRSESLNTSDRIITSYGLEIAKRLPDGNILILAPHLTKRSQTTDGHIRDVYHALCDGSIVGPLFCQCKKYGGDGVILEVLEDVDCSERYVKPKKPPRLTKEQRQAKLIMPPEEEFKGCAVRRRRRRP